MKACPWCGEQIQDEAIKCRFCGEFLQREQQQVIPVQPAGAGTQTSGLAVGSLILGLVGIFFFPLLIVAMILGIAALSQIKKSNGQLTGGGMAVAGIVLGSIGVLATIAIVVAIAIPAFIESKNLAEHWEQEEWTPAPAERSAELEEPVAPESPEPVVEPEAEPELVKPPVVCWIQIEVEADTWREDSEPFDIGKELEERLSFVGVGVKESGEEVRALLQVMYEEEKGAGYAWSPFAETPSDWGTNISCTINVSDIKTEEDIFNCEISSSPPTTVSDMNSLYECSMDAFRAEAAFMFAPEMIAAALGVESAYPKCIPGLLYDDVSDNILALLEKAGYKPQNDREKACFAIANEDFEKCASLGEAAVGPITEYIHRYYWHENYDTQDTAGLLRAALLKIGGKKASGIISGLLWEFAQDQIDYRLSTGVNEEEDIELIRSAGEVGSEKDLQALDIIINFVKEQIKEREGYGEEDFADILKAAGEAKKAIKERTGEK